MQTELEYLNDTYKFESEAKFLAEGRDERGRYIVLDRTIFYPQGGGQPSDTGALQVGGVEVPVSFVGYSQGSVRHYFHDSVNFDAETGACAHLYVNQLLRLSHARAHTGGHLLSHIVEEMIHGVVATKGYHFPDGAHVEFKNPQRLPLGERLEEINDKIQFEINAVLSVDAELASYDLINDVTPHLAPFVPKDKPSRIVRIGHHAILPCGGTHVANLGQLGRMTVTKIKNRKDTTKISYKMENPDYAI